MGLIKAIAGAIGGTLADQWKEFFYCDAISEDVLVVKGQKRITNRSSNTKGNDNIISNGSGIAVADGQCMIIVDQGKVVEVCAEPGEFTFDTSSEPSIFAGKFGQSLIDTFKVIGRRIAYGGDTGKDQRVYYINTKEITGNKFGTANPVPFKVVINEQLGYKLSVDLRFNGTYSYRMFDPLLFYTSVSGNVSDEYTRDRIDSMLKSELIMALQPALATISAAGVSYDQIPAHTEEIRVALNNELKDSWGKRGIEVFSMNFGVPSIPEDQRKKITEWEETSMTLDPNVAAARYVGGTISAMNTAAGNAAGAMNGFVGVGMVNNMAGTNAAQLYGIGAQQQAAAPAAPAAPAAAGWTCPNCGSAATGKFCAECGTAKPAPAAAWTCPKCGNACTGKFCPECGTAKPAAEWICPKCGKTNTGKFCPDCGTSRA